MEGATKKLGRNLFFSWKRIKMLSGCLFLIFIFILQTESGIVYEDQVEKIGHKGQCYNKEENIFYNKGEILKNEENECYQSHCLGSIPKTGKVRIKILTCPKVEAGFGCKIVQNPNKPYPECCPRIVPDNSDQTGLCQKQEAE